VLVALVERHQSKEVSVQIRQSPLYHLLQSVAVMVVEELAQAFLLEMAGVVAVLVDSRDRQPD
jgi:hypothetical protein